MRQIAFLFVHVFNERYTLEIVEFSKEFADKMQCLRISMTVEVLTTILMIPVTWHCFITHNFTTTAVEYCDADLKIQQALQYAHRCPR